MDCLSLNSEFPTLTLEAFVYESERETASIVENLSSNYDLLLFAGPVPYKQSLTISKRKNIPSIYVPYHGSGLLRALFQARKLADIKLFSVDTVDLKLLWEAFEELGLKYKPPFITEFDIHQDSMNLADYHSNLYYEGKTKGAITGLATCYKELLSRGVPSIKIHPFKSVIRDTLNKAKLICDSIHNKENQISVGFVSVNDFEIWANNKTISEIEEFESILEDSVATFVKELDGQYLQTSPREFLFFTTRAFIDKATKGYTALPSIFNKDHLPKSIKLNLGIGMGGTTNSAADSAKIAAHKVLDVGDDSCFIVNEQQQLIEISKDVTTSEKIELRTTNQEIIEMAECIGMSTMTLRRVFRAIQHVGDEFTANEIAPFMDITVKSMQRILRNLRKGNVIMVVGQETLQSKGKPRQVYKLKSKRLLI